MSFGLDLFPSGGRDASRQLVDTFDTRTGAPFLGGGASRVGAALDVTGYAWIYGMVLADAVAPGTVIVRQALVAVDLGTINNVTDRIATVADPTTAVQVARFLIAVSGRFVRVDYLNGAGPQAALFDLVAQARGHR